MRVEDQDFLQSLMRDFYLDMSVIEVAIQDMRSPIPIADDTFDIIPPPVRGSRIDTRFGRLARSAGLGHGEASQ